MRKLEYKCPHCGKVIKEVNVIELSARQVILSAILGFGVGLVTFPLTYFLPADVGLAGSVGAFVVSFVIAFLFLRRK